MIIDLHTHSSVSDGTDAPAALVAKAAREGLDVLALTDHDTFAGLAEAQQAAERHGVQLVPGIEMSTQHEGRSVHLLGYGARTDDPALTAELVRVRAGREDRLTPLLQRLAELGLPLSEEQVRVHVGASPSVGRPHVADAMVAAGYVANRAEAFDRYLADGGPAHVPRYATPLRKGIRLIRAAGGVTVVAHPWGRDREWLLPEPLWPELVEAGLDGIEVDHYDHGPEQRRRLRALAGRTGLLPTGSSDHHGLGKVDHELASNTTAPEVLAEIRARLAARRSPAG
ncbi:PHP domain-containing protein [Auraticoccus sp. F435]|uniref:PHP domain-containing protein n=1 Tax=Auraticoccus cholistanensis TaxID=2656650 RepID=A0A6A9V0S7_9ACTN|nr:PHP domain-containing protein [Auraticoccus cholistanensis]